MTSFFCPCPVNLTFLALQRPISNQKSTHGSQTSQITSNLNSKPLTRSKYLSENLNLKWLCDMKLFKSNYIKTLPLTTTQGLSKNLRLKFLCDLTFPLLSDQSHSPCFTKQICDEVSTLGRQTFRIMLNWNKNLYLHPKTYCKELIWSGCVTFFSLYYKVLQHF